MPPAAGDYTLLLDDIRICPGDCRPSPPVAIGFTPGPSPTVRLSWPTSYTGYVLQSTDDLLTGPWAEVGFPVQVEGDNFVVIDDAAGVQRRFYRLRSPIP